MIKNAQEKVFSSLQISEEKFLNEMAILLVKQQLSEYSMEVEYFEKKYKKKFEDFDRDFKNQTASYELENEWMSWKFAVDSQNYWKDILVKSHDS